MDIQDKNRDSLDPKENTRGQDGEDILKKNKSNQLQDKIEILISQIIGSRLNFISSTQNIHQQSIENYNITLSRLSKDAEKLLETLQNISEQQLLKQSDIIIQKQNQVQPKARSPKQTASIFPTIETKINLPSINVSNVSVLKVIKESALDNVSSNINQKQSALVKSASTVNLSTIRSPSKLKQWPLETQTDNKQDFILKTEVADSLKIQEIPQESQDTGRNTPRTHHPIKEKPTQQIIGKQDIPKILDLKTQRSLAKNKVLSQQKQDVSEKRKLSESNLAPKEKIDAKKITNGRKDNAKHEDLKVKSEKKVSASKSIVSDVNSNVVSDETHINSFKTSTQAVTIKNSISKKEITVQENTQAHTNEEKTKKESTSPEIIVNLIETDKNQFTPICLKETNNRRDIISEGQVESQLEFEGNQITDINQNLHQEVEEENLLADISEVETQQNSINQKESKSEEKEDQFGDLINNYIEGKSGPRPLIEYIQTHSDLKDKLGDRLVFTQISLQNQIDVFMETNPNAGIFGETFKLSASTKEGLSLLDLDFMLDLVEKDDFEDSIINLFELLFMLMGQQQYSLFTQEVNKENYIRKFINKNHEDLVSQIEDLGLQVSTLNTDYFLKQIINQYVKEHPFVIDQDHYVQIDAMCSLISPVLEEIISFLGLKETPTNKKNVIYFQYQHFEDYRAKIEYINNLIISNLE